MRFRLERGEDGAPTCFRIGRVLIHGQCEWTQLFSPGRLNWFHFHPINLYIERTFYVGPGAWEFHAALLGLCLYVDIEPTEYGPAVTMLHQARAEHMANREEPADG